MSSSLDAAAEALDAVVGTFVAALLGAGVRHVCACPGSRSTPLAIEFARHPGIKLWMHLDERSAAYFGLGLARAGREPVALLATSGTAAANFFPAIVEANLARVPLVVLSGDRPHELRDNGAAQTIDQLRLYGHHVKWFFDMPEPDGSAQQQRLVTTIAARAVATSSAEPAGPVHLNWPFRDPLVPAPAGAVSRSVAIVSVHNPRLAPTPELVDDLAAQLDGSPRGLIVAGPDDNEPAVARAIVHLAERLGYPILADALSGLRRGVHDDAPIVDTYDAFLRDRTSVSALEPEVVLRFGALPTSKPLQQYLEGLPDSRSIVVDPGGWREPSSQASDLLHVDPELLCQALVQAVSERGTSDWRDTWLRLNAAARRAIDAHLAELDELFEGKVFSCLAEALPASALIFAGNSMPVRDLDTFLPRSSLALRCLANRGANGIDGVVSSALGASAAGVGPVVLVIGDVSFYHDMNGLLAARKHALDLLVVLLNNDGGGIFSFLPQAEAAPENFELLFGTPHGLDFRPFVEGYGGDFVSVQEWGSFASAVTDGLRRGGLRVIEVPTERAHNVVQHRAVWRAVAEALSLATVA
jgi:2-succinyl-5-enolpyruvyl-6-hydroxy-3-cyclohexene-1-carboxylate synthase